jgi:nitrate reductase cytochrome c-type subunit
MTTPRTTGHHPRTVALAAAALALVSLLASAAPAQSPSREPSPPATGRLPRPSPGAPPLVPHEVEDRRTICQDCHTSGVDGAPITPHPTRAYFCVACHVGQDRSAPAFPPGTTSR